MCLVVLVWGMVGCDEEGCDEVGLTRDCRLLFVVLDVFDVDDFMWVTIVSLNEFLIELSHSLRCSSMTDLMSTDIICLSSSTWGCLVRTVL